MSSTVPLEPTPGVPKRHFGVHLDAKRGDKALNSLTKTTRREILSITLLGGAAAAWPLAARAQQDARVRRIGVLAGGNDSFLQANLAAMREGLAKLGWVEGRN